MREGDEDTLKKLPVNFSDATTDSNSCGDKVETHVF